MAGVLAGGLFAVLGREETTDDPTRDVPNAPAERDPDAAPLDPRRVRRRVLSAVSGRRFRRSEPGVVDDAPAGRVGGRDSTLVRGQSVGRGNDRREPVAVRYLPRPKLRLLR